MALGPTEWLIILGAVVLLFGASAIPKLARSVGQAKGEFAKAKREFDAEVARAERGEAGQVSEEQIRKTARDLGIPEQGRSLEEVKRDVTTRLG